MKNVIKIIAAKSKGRKERSGRPSDEQCVHTRSGFNDRVESKASRLQADDVEYDAAHGGHRQRGHREEVR